MKKSDSVSSEMNELTEGETGRVFHSSKSRVVSLINWLRIINLYLPYLFHLTVTILGIQVLRKLYEKNFDFYAFYTREFDWSNFDRNDLYFLGWKSMLLLAFLVYYLTHRERPVYLMDFTTFQPPESWRLSPEQIYEILVKHGVYSPEALEFQKKMLQQSGPGPKTAWPPAIVKVLEGGKYEGNIEDSRKEAEIVMFDCVEKLLANTGVKAKDIDFLVVNCSLFSPTPSLASMIINRFDMRPDVSSYNLSGMGCSAGIISLELCKNLLNSRANSRAIIVSTEIITPNLYCGEDKGFLLQNLLFRCGGAALLLSNRLQDRLLANFKLMQVIRTHYISKPKTVISKNDKVEVKSNGEWVVGLAGTVTQVNGKGDDATYDVKFSDNERVKKVLRDNKLSSELLGVKSGDVRPYHFDSFGCVYETQDKYGNRGVRLAKDLVSIAGRAMEQNLTAMAPHVLSLSEQAKVVWSIVKKKFLGFKNEKIYIPDFKSGIDHWCIHAGGRGVIDGVQENLKLHDFNVEPSRKALHEYGNTSSSSIWYEMDYIRKNQIVGHELKRSHKVIQIGFGSGFKCNSCVWLCINPMPKRKTPKNSDEKKKQ